MGVYRKMRISGDDEGPEDVKPQPVKRGRGRPPGSMNMMSRLARERARESGELPHEIMLSMARGLPQKVASVDKETGEIVWKLECPTLEMRGDMAKAAAPYFASKLSTVELLSGVSDDEIDAAIAGLAAEAGFAGLARTEGEEGSGEGEEDDADD